MAYFLILLLAALCLFVAHDTDNLQLAIPVLLGAAVVAKIVEASRARRDRVRRKRPTEEDAA